MLDQAALMRRLAHVYAPSTPGRSPWSGRGGKPKITTPTSPRSTRR